MKAVGYFAVVEGGLGHGAGHYVLHLNADESSTLAGLYMLELNDLHDLAVHVEGNAISKITG